MGKFSFKKNERLLKRDEFKKILDHGQKKRIDTVCTLFWLPNDLERRRLGIIASKKIGSAVVRNKAKRRVREIFRQNSYKMIPAIDLVVIIGKGMVDLPFSVLEKKIVQILRA
ncbi:MAG: ribonuclease P protein component [Nitrospinales bacterium]